MMCLFTQVQRASTPVSIHVLFSVYKYMKENNNTPKTGDNMEVIFGEEASFTPTREGGLAELTSLAKTMIEISPSTIWDSVILPSLIKANATSLNPISDVDVINVYNCAKMEQQELTKAKTIVQEEEDIRVSFKKSLKIGTYNLALYMVKTHSIITIGEKEREMFVYENGIYYRAENEIIFPEIQRILGEAVTKSAKSETFHKIADMTSYPRDVFSSAPLNLVPLLNGVYDLNTNLLLPHSPEYRFKYQFPVTYNKDSTCPKTIAFFDQVLNPVQKKIVQEWMGYYFYRLYLFKKAIIFVGEGDTGKTTLLETIIHLIGKENISSISLQKMSGDKFSAAHLYEKHGNLVDELSAKDITDTGQFKIATGGGSISGEYKFGNQFSFNNFSKLTFACNKIPDVKDFDDIAYFNRWMIISFEKTIEKKIPNFIATLTTKEERAGLFNYAMMGLARLLEKGKFSYESSAMETKKEMMKSGSSIAVFASTQIDQDQGTEISKEKMYDHYCDFCLANEMPTETIKMFGTKFLFYCTFASEGLITAPNGKRVSGWRNVAVKKTEVQEKIAEKTDKDFESFDVVENRLEELKKVENK